MTTVQQIAMYQSAKQPKMFLNLMREGMSKDMQVKIKERFEVGLNKQVKRII